MSKLEEYQARILEICPDLDVKSLQLNTDGLLNDVVTVNDELVFRLAKRDFGYKDPQEEAKLLHFLGQHITLPIPSPFHTGPDVMAYRLIPGSTLRRDVLLRLPEENQQVIADQLAQFLKELHSVPVNQAPDFKIGMADTLRTYEGWIGVYQRIREKVFPLLLPHVRDWATGHFESHLADKANFEYELKMIDSDIPPYHIMFDAQKKRISGIIDFSCAGLGDPAVDLGVLIYHYGESFVERFYRIYAEAETYLKRARFYAGSQELRWLLTGIERNNNWWFAVHAGSAKDMKY